VGIMTEKASRAGSGTVDESQDADALDTVWRTTGWSFAARLALSLALVGAALVLRFLMPPLPASLPFLTLFPAVVLCFVLCGRGPGVIATVLSAVSGHFFFVDPHGVLAPGQKPLIFAAAFVLSSLMIGLLIEDQVRRRRRTHELAMTQRLMLDAELIGMAKVRDRQIVWCNRKLEQILGYDPGELVGQLTRVGFPDDESWHAFTRTIQTALSGGKSYRAAVTLIGKQGDERIIDLSTIVIDAQTGEILCLVDDITSRTAMDARLRQKLAFLDRVGSAALIGAWRYNIETDGIEWSEEMVRLLDMAPDAKPSARELLRWFTPETRGPLRRALRGAIERVESCDLEAEVCTPSGRRFWARVVAVPECEDGKPIRLDGVVQDITRWRDVTNALRETKYQQATEQALLDTLFRRAREIMVIARVEWDGDTPSFVYEGMNPVWERVTGLSAADCVGHSPADVLSPALAEAICGGWMRCVTARRPCTYPFISPGADQAEWESSVVPILDERGVVRRLVVVGHDMSERIRLDNRMWQLQRMEAVGQLTAGVAHDFNNILQSILMTLDVLHERPGVPDDIRRHVSVALDASNRGATLVRRLLAFSRQQMLTPVLIDTSAVFSDLSHLLATVVGARIEIDVTAEPDAWFVRADPAQLDDCLLNLAINARDAMNGVGSLTLAVRNMEAKAVRIHDLPDGDYVCLEMTDTGTGMMPEIAARALEPFFTTKEIGKGSGLGLSMVQGFARQSGGDIRIETAPGRGTTVSIWLPRVPGVAGSGQGPKDSAPCRRSIVLVDDDEAVRDTLGQFLDEAGLDVAAFDNGAEALRHIKAGAPCTVLITDQSMPGMSGTELIAAVHALRPDLPTLIITGFDKVSGLHEISSRISILTKPFRMRELMGKIDALADEQAMLTPA
jgi:PAS domain S-box-containing protein